MPEMEAIQLQRLVDGRLSLSEVQTMLRNAAQEPDQWRAIALAFMEEQLVGRELTAEVSGRQPAPSDSSGGGRRASAEDWNAENPLPLTPNFRGTNAPTGRTGLPLPDRLHPGIGRWLSIAALLLLLPMSFAAGRWSGSLPSSGPSDRVAGHADRLPSGATPTFAAVDPAKGNLNRGGAAPITNTVNHMPEINAPYSLNWKWEDQSDSTPLLTESMAREINYQPVAQPVSGELQDRYRRRGYELQPNIHYLSMSTEDGREIILPIEVVRLKKFGL